MTATNRFFSLLFYFPIIALPELHADKVTSFSLLHLLATPFVYESVRDFFLIHHF